MDFISTSSISFKTLHKELMRIRINRPPSATQPSKSTAAHVALGSNEPKKQNISKRSGVGTARGELRLC